MQRLLAATFLGVLGVSVGRGDEFPRPGVFHRYSSLPTAPPAAFAFGDGDIWFTEPSVNRIGRLRIDGTIEEFDVPTPDAGLAGIATSFTAGGTLVWFTESNANRIGRIGPDGTIAEFRVPTPASRPWGIANNIFAEQVWFTERTGNAVAMIDEDGSITEHAISTPGVSPAAIEFIGVPGGEDIWIASSARNSVARLPFPRYDNLVEIVLPNPASEPFALAAAPDGTLWFTERGGDRIGRIGQDFSLTEFAVPTGSRPSAIAAELFGGEFLWITETGSNRVSMVSLEGQITEYSLPAGVSGPSGIITDGDQAWFGTLTPGSLVRAQPDIQLFVGAGESGPWQSQIELAGTEPADRTVFLAVYPFPPGACPGSCFGITTMDLPPMGAASVTGPTFQGPGLATVYERPIGTALLPAAHFRFTNTARPTQSADAAVARLSDVSAVDPAFLAFPSASHGPSSKSNLFLSNVGNDGPVAARVEAYHPDGTLLGATETSLETREQKILAEVLGLVGAGAVENAQVRVTKIQGAGLLWGMLATTDDDAGTLSISTGTNFAAVEDTVLIGGAGVAGSWDTVIDLANPLANGITGELRKRGAASPGPCPPECLDASYAIASNGAARVLASSFLSDEWTQTRLLATTGPAIVHARVVNRANPVQAADLPTIPLSRLRAANPDVLVFPSARRGDGVRTNLFLVGVGDGDPVHVRVEALSADGAVLAVGELDVASWDQPGSTFVVDLLVQLGVFNLELGQVRVTRENGNGSQLLWGVLSNVYADGRLSVVAPELR